RFYTLIIPFVCIGVFNHFVMKSSFTGLWFLRSLFEAIVINMAYEYIKHKFHLGAIWDLSYYLLVYIMINLIAKMHNPIEDSIFNLQALSNQHYLVFCFGCLCRRYEKVSKLINRNIIYTISFGNDGSSYTESQIVRCRKLITKFDAVSVREGEAINIINRFHWTPKQTPEIVLDPTLLLEKEDYNRLIAKANVFTQKQKGIFCYILDMNDDKKGLIQLISNKLNLPYYIIDTLFPNRDKNCHKLTILNPSIEQWLRNVKDADFIITDSFHGTLFSILYNKPFLTIENSSRGSKRYEPLLSQLNLSNHYIRNIKDLKQIFLEVKNLMIIDWPLVNKKLEVLRKKSLQFLISNL
ncbi:MAG: polysaccharide pyruvyl transferase family protein, partial [Bacteroidaceae bacterium]